MHDSLAQEIPKDDPVDRNNTTYTYCAIPVIHYSILRDIHEGGFRGAEGFAYFTNSVGTKKGRLPAYLGNGSNRRNYNTCAYGSNFQGPIKVVASGVDQWEWTADGWNQYSYKKYPVIDAIQCTSSRYGFGKKRMGVAEDDHSRSSGDDAVGSFELDRSPCSAVLGSRASGWSSTQRSYGKPFTHNGDTENDVVRVDYKLYCYKCRGTSDCRLGVPYYSRYGSPSCSSSNPTPTPTPFPKDQW